MPAKKTPLEQLNATLTKKLGPDNGSLVTTLGHENKLVSQVTSFIPTGILPLDVVLGGGWPMGRVVEVFGHEASGKSMLAALACAQAQKMGYLTVYLDTEFTVDQDFFAALGVDLDALYYISPSSLDDVFTILEAMYDFKKEHYNEKVGMVFVWDSVASTFNKDEAKRGWEDKGYGTAANYISQAFRKLRGTFGPNNTLFFLTNQIRSNVGVLYGNMHTTYGGYAIKFYSTVRLQLDEEGKERIGEKRERKRVIGQNIRVEAVKNKITTPFRSCLLPMSYIDIGIDEATATLTMLKELGLVGQGGGGIYRIADLPGVGEISFTKNDVAELITAYRDQLYAYMFLGWMKLPSSKKEEEDTEDE